MDLGLASRQVERVTSEYAISLVLSGGPELRIETKFQIARPNLGVLVVDPQDLDAEQEVLDALLGRTVDHAAADDATGSLAITFFGEVRLDVQPDPDYEAWSFVGLDGSQVVSLPGGGLSRWGASH